MEIDYYLIKLVKVIMNLKRLFGVLFITIMLLSMPCAYATDDSSDNSEFIIKDVNTIGNSFIVSVITECSVIISLYKSNLMKRYNGANGKKASGTSRNS